MKKLLKGNFENYRSSWERTIMGEYNIRNRSSLDRISKERIGIANSYNQNVQGFKTVIRRIQMCSAFDEISAQQKIYRISEEMKKILKKYMIYFIFVGLHYNLLIAINRIIVTGICSWISSLSWNVCIFYHFTISLI